MREQCRSGEIEGLWFVFVGVCVSVEVSVEAI